MTRGSEVVRLALACVAALSAGCKDKVRSDGDGARAMSPRDPSARAPARPAVAAGATKQQVAAAASASANGKPADGVSPTAEGGKPAAASPSGGSGPGATGSGQPDTDGSGARASSAAAAPDPSDKRFPLRHTANNGDPVTDKIQRRIRYQLRGVSPAPIALRDLLQVTRADGGADVYAIYEVSVYEECVKGAASRQEGRSKCLEEPVSVVVGDNPNYDYEHDRGDRYSYKQVRLGRDCRKYGAVHATFGAPPAGKSLEEAGSLKVSSLPLPEIDCELKTLSQFFVDDVDADRRPELYLDVTSARPVVRNRRGNYTDDIDVEEVQRRRHVLILGASGEGLALEARIADADVSVRDLNRDGHADLVAIGACLIDLAEGSMGWSEPVCVREARERTWYLYDRELDRWVLDGEPPIGEGSNGAAPGEGKP
jgi:hypothetical protein